MTQRIHSGAPMTLYRIAIPLFIAVLYSIAAGPSPGFALDDIDATISNLHNPDPVVRRSAVKELATQHDPRVVAPLKGALHDPDDRVRTLAKSALENLAENDIHTKDRQAADSNQMMAAVSSDGLQRVAIVVDSYSYTPDHLIVKRGVPVELTLTSVTWLVPHNFVVNDPDSGLKINQEVPAGKSVTIRFTPEQVGQFKYFCDKKLLFFPSHEEKGMRGTLEVRE
jgi:plastocyanin